MEFQKDVKIRQEKFGAVVFETLSEKVFVTNETGGEILRLLQKNKEPREMIAELVKDYDCDPVVIKNQMDEFILRLKEKGIIEKENANGAK